MASNTATNNEILKYVCGKLNTKLTSAVNANSIIDVLLAEGILSVAEYRALREIRQRQLKTGRLLAFLHSQNRPRAFIVLRDAMQQEKAYERIVEEVDKLYGSFKQTDTRTNNEILKDVCKKLNAKLTLAVNVNSIIDVLFAEGILNFADSRALRQIQQGPLQTGNLLALLHSRNHPWAFIVLREALQQVKAYDRIVEEVDNIYRCQEMSSGVGEICEVVKATYVDTSDDNGSKATFLITEIIKEKLKRSKVYNGEIQTSPSAEFCLVNEQFVFPVSNEHLIPGKKYSITGPHADSHFDIKLQ